MTMVSIQTSLVGYLDQPASLFSAYDLAARILWVQMALPFKPERHDGSVVITNQADLDRDLLFHEDNLLDAVRCYFAMKHGLSSDGKSSRLILDAAVLNADPATSIEQGARDMSGQTYRINDNLSCLQVAVLATCWYAHHRCDTINATLNQAKAIQALAKPTLFKL